MSENNTNVYTIVDIEYEDEPSYFDVIVKNDDGKFEDFIRSVEAEFYDIDENLIFTDFMKQEIINSKYEVEFIKIIKIKVR